MMTVTQSVINSIQFSFLTRSLTATLIHSLTDSSFRPHSINDFNCKYYTEYVHSLNNWVCELGWWWEKDETWKVLGLIQFELCSVWVCETCYANSNLKEGRMEGFEGGRNGSTFLHHLDVGMKPSVSLFLLLLSKSFADFFLSNCFLCVSFGYTFSYYFHCNKSSSFWLLSFLQENSLLASCLVAQGGMKVTCEEKYLWDGMKDLTLV